MNRSHNSGVPVQIVAVLGVCAPETARFASGVEGAVHLTTARETEDGAAASVRHAADLAAPGTRVVLQCSTAVTAHDLLALFAEHGGPLPASLRLAEIVTVVDAMHLISDLEGRGTVDRTWEGRNSPEPLATIAIDQIEHADTIVVTGWRRASRSQHARLLTLLAHLNPDARLTMFDAARKHQQLVSGTRRAVAPGWVQLLNADFDPYLTGYGITAYRYEQLRPFHPERLRLLLESGFEHLHGHLIRSAGLCRIATRPGITGKWDQIGPRIAFRPVAFDHAGDDPLPVGQEIAFIGLELNTASMTAALDSCALTDTELAAGPVSWRTYPDPLPSWGDAILSRRDRT